MTNCLLCQQRNADKTGSHIIPSFFMKRINGNGKRDHEIGFEIKNSIIDIYFGRDIYEEERKVITENKKKLYSKENHDIKDHIFCKYCEKYFASLESKYAHSLNLHFSNKSNTINTRTTPSDALLFWCSLIWRASATGHLGSRLNPDLEDRLRQSLILNKTDNLNIKYALFRCKDYSKQPGHWTVLCMDIVDNNVLLFVDDFMLAMFFDMKEDEEEHKIELFNIRLNLKNNSLNDGERKEEISPISHINFSFLMNSIIRIMINSMQLPEKFKELHKTIFREEISDRILFEIYNLVLNTGKLGDRYTIEHYCECYKEVLKKHGLIVENEDNTFRIINKQSNCNH